MPGKVRNLLLTTEVRSAGKLCRCSHDKRHQIHKGELRVVIKTPGGIGEKGYCAACGRAMVAAARQQLATLEAQLGAPVPQNAISGSEGS